MEKKNQVPKYPHLRFPEFTDEWKEVKLGEVLSFETGYPFSSDAFNEEGNGVRLIKNRDLKADDRVVFYGGEYDAQYIVQNGDILIGMDGDFSPCLWKKGKALLNQRVGRVNVNRNTSRVFILYVLIDSLKKIELKTSSTTVKHLSHKDVEKIKASLPSFPEQRKIAALLSLIDERIEVQNAIIKEQEVAKTSLIRRLFDRTLRFPEFTDEWKQNPLGEICKVSTGEMNTQDKNENGMYPFYVRSSKIERANRYTYDGVAILTPGDGAIGQIFHYSEGKIAVHQRVYMLTEMQCIPKYLFHCFSSRFFERVSRMSAKNTVDSVRMNMITNMLIALPSLPEQRKIAALLSAVDERIAVERAYAEQLKQQKTYLLRQMFI